jgi:thioredoxin reductase (NADPH)
MKTYDVVIIGAGAAGLTAGLYSARNGLKTAIISKDIGGTANSILSLENWPGFNGKGSELMKQIYEQVQKYEIDFIMAEVDSIEKEKDEFLIKTKKEKLNSKTIIIATGTDRKKLGIGGEDELVGRGVSYCVTCDAFFFKNKDVAVIGGSDCAVTSALALSDLSKNVYLVYRGEKLRCEELNQQRLKQKKNVNIFYGAVPKDIIGKDKVEGLDILQKGKLQRLNVDGIFVEVGSTPLIEFTKKLGIKLDKENFIKVDEDMRTSVESIFAAGDITSHKLKQVVVSASQGAIAAKSVYNWLKGGKE